MKSNRLIGKFWPVKNTDNEIIGFKTITDAKGLENFAGYVIELNNAGTYITIGHGVAVKIVENKLYQLLD